MSVKLVLVAAGALIDTDGRILIAQRPEGRSMAGLWEFPGGKAEDGETLEQCIIRECQEELGVDIKVCGEVGKTSYPHGSSDMEFTFFSAEIIGGTLTTIIHEKINWVPAENLKDYTFCPADVEIVEKLVNKKPT